jgi:hypothetical protein
VLLDCVVGKEQRNIVTRWLYLFSIWRFCLITVSFNEVTYMTGDISDIIYKFHALNTLICASIILRISKAIHLNVKHILKEMYLKNFTPTSAILMNLPQKLALTSPTSGGRSVGIDCSQTKATELVTVDCVLPLLCNLEIVISFLCPKTSMN